MFFDEKKKWNEDDLISGIYLQIFQLHEGEGSNFELSDGVGCQVQCLQGNVWLQLIHRQLWDPIVDSESYKKNDEE